MLPHHGTATPAHTPESSIQDAIDIYAPGHLGELTRIVDTTMTDAVLDDTHRQHHRLRSLPSRVGMYFVLALGLFPARGYLAVWASLTRSMPAAATPTAKALRDLRRRLGPAPFRHLFDLLAGPLAAPHSPGSSWHGYRMVSFDGCRSIKVPDSDTNQAWLTKLKAIAGTTGYPVIQLMTLVETGTRGLIGAVFGSPKQGELSWAKQLLTHLNEQMLVLMDRGFDAADFLADVHDTSAKFLVRIKDQRKPAIIGTHPDGSVHALIGRVEVRIISAHIAITCADGTTYGDHYRLATTLLDPVAHPADELIEVYHQRWEHEVAYLSLRHTLLDGRVLRSRDPAGIEQELWALLCVYQSLRIAVTDAVATKPGVDPDRVDFTLAVTTAQDLVIAGRNTTDEAGDLIGTIGAAILARPVPARRGRVSPRRVKSPISRWAKHPPGKPRQTLRVVQMLITTTTGIQPQDNESTRHRPGSLTQPSAVPNHLNYPAL